MKMSRHFLCLGYLFAGICPAVSSVYAVQIVDGYTRYIEETQQQRISEFFTGREPVRGVIILRSQKDKRAGQYFIITLDKKARDLPPGTKLELKVITTESTEPRSYNLVLDETDSKSRQIYAGLTGSDWAGQNVRPLAWKISIVDASGQILAVTESFLWRYP